MNIIQGIEKPKGLCLILAAVEGFGKTTLASKLPAPLFIDTDKGLAGLDVARIPFSGRIGELEGIIKELSTMGTSQYRTLVIDTADALEAVLTEDFCKEKNWKSMEEFDYGKCWATWKPRFAKILDELKDLARRDGWIVCFTAHVQVKEFVDVLRGEKYNRIQLKLANSTSALLKEWADVYMTGCFVTDVYTDQVGMKTVNHAVSSKRMCYFEHNEKYDAKCRACLKLADGKEFPKQIELNALAKVFGDALEASTSFAEPQKKAVKESPQSAPKSEKAVKAKETVNATDWIPQDAEPAPADEIPAELLDEKSTAADIPEYIVTLRTAMKQFGIEDEPLRAYLKAKGKFGQDIWPVDEIPESVAEWILRGIDKIAEKINNK